MTRVREYFEQGFTISEIGTATMTGYYEPTLRGNLSRSSEFATSLLAVPPRDWARRPPPTRALAGVAASAEASSVDTPTPLQADAGLAQLAQDDKVAADPATEATSAGGLLPEAAATSSPAPDQPIAAIPPPPAARRPVTRSVPAVVPRAAPYPSRAEIDDGVLAGHGLELAWVDSAVDAFFLHIQGSGRVVLPDGTLLRLGYAAQNGHPYRAIGRILIERGEMRREGMSMQGIRAWLAAAPPEAAQGLMRANASYIFFRLVEGLRPEDGPIGAMGVPLTPLRSVAVDPAFVPMGAPLFLASPVPPTPSPPPERARARPQPVEPAGPLPRLVVAQDTGGAIRGAGRSDLFWGWDAESGLRAGGTFQPARMFLLRPRLPD